MLGSVLIAIIVHIACLKVGLGLAQRGQAITQQHRERLARAANYSKQLPITIHECCQFHTAYFYWSNRIILSYKK